MSPTLGMLLAQLPALLLTTAGVAVAVIRWSRHPTVSMMVIVGLVLRLFAGLSTSVFAPTLVNAPMAWAIFGALNLVGVGGSGLLIAAAFVDRR